MDGSGLLFDGFVSALGAKTLVVSYPREQPLGYEQLEAFVQRKLPVDEPYVLLGESFSGPIAIALAAKGLPGLKAVVLVCTFAQMRRPRAPAFLHALIERLPFWRIPVALGARGLFGRFDGAAVRARLAQAIEGVQPSVWRMRLRSVLNVDVTPQLERIRVPVLYLRASEDRVVPARAAELISQRHAHVRIATVDGPHALLQTNPGDCAAALRAFAKGNGLEL
jgi:pimeloyl-ACP methyl ester carboxylesterase